MPLRTMSAAALRSLDLHLDDRSGRIDEHRNAGYRGQQLTQ